MDPGKKIKICFCLIAFLLPSCKQKKKPETVEGKGNTESIYNKQEDLNGEQKDTASEREENIIDMHLFDDGEQLIFFESELMPDDSEDIDIKSLYYREYLNLVIAEAFTESGELNLTGGAAAAKVLIKESSGTSFKKGIVRLFESLQHKFRKVVFGKNYKKKYFDKAIKKKRNQVLAGTYSAYDRLPGISTRLKIGSDLKMPKSNIFLGMLPDDKIVKSIRNEIAKSTGRKSPKLEIVSIIEDFELGRAKKEMGIGENIYVTGRSDIEFLGGGRYRIEIDTSGGAIKKIGVNKWTQYATPDRTMLNRKVLSEAIEDSANAMKNGKSVYIHCKSGKGRSATVVVGARSSVVIDAAKANNVQLTKKQIDQLIEEQILQVKSARSEIGISFAQKTNLKRVLYERAVIY